MFRKTVGRWEENKAQEVDRKTTEEGWEENSKMMNIDRSNVKEC